MKLRGTRQLKLSELKPHPSNPRVHDLETIKRSLERNGQYRAIVVQAKTLTILAGHGTAKAAGELGWTRLLCHLVDATAVEAKRIMLVDNRASDLAGYDDRKLADLLESLPDLDGTGYQQGTVDELLHSLNPAQPPTDDEPPVPKKPVTKPGDLWLLGDHRLLCGDCRASIDVERLLDGQTINVAITSPPYADRRVYDESSGFAPVPPNEYVDWFDDVQANVAASLAGDGSWFVNIKPGVTPDGLNTELYVLDLVVAHARRWGWHFATEFCWQRNGVPKAVTRRFKNQFEPVYQFTRGDWKMRPDAVRHESDSVPIAGGPGVGDTGWANAQGGNGAMFGRAKKRKHGVRAHGDEERGTYGSNWQPGEMIAPGLAYPGNRLPTFASTHQATGHTAAFPVGFAEFFVCAYSDPADVIFDPFMGSGSTLMAAEHQHRRGYGIEISPGYCDVIVRRWEEHTGGKAKRGPA